MVDVSIRLCVKRFDYEIWAPEQNGGDSRNVLAHLDEWMLARVPDLVYVNCSLHDLKRILA